MTKVAITEAIRTCLADRICISLDDLVEGLLCYE